MAEMKNEMAKLGEKQENLVKAVREIAKDTAHSIKHIDKKNMKGQMEERNR